MRTERRHDLDWLRVIATVLVFLFHCARFYGGGGWHLKHPGPESLPAGLFIGLLDLWLMPFFFLLSGAASFYALGSRSAGQYLRSRVKRILLPLYGMGAFVVLLPQVYFEAVTNGGYTGGFWEGLPRYLAQVFTTPPSLRTPFFFNLFFGHLWFLHFLFLISVFSLPLLLYLRSDAGRQRLDRLAALCAYRGGILLIILPLAAVRIAFIHLFDGQAHSWAHLLYFGLFFIIGYLLPMERRFSQGIRTVGWWCLLLGILGFGAEGFFILGLEYNYMNLYHSGGEPLSWTYVAFNLLFSTASWSWVVFMLSMGLRYMRSGSRFLFYANEAVLPFYVLHQTVILCVGWLVLPLTIGRLPQFLLIATAAFAAIMLLYEGLIRRVNWLRFISGMGPL
ncbi:MAG: acyltransferase family protein [Desulfosarcinaceae bacterium]|nr:acyltransferase family protein [Desulfosarcinaceae bacterium]